MRNDNLGTQQIDRGVARAYISVPGSRWLHHLIIIIMQTYLKALNY